MASGNEPPCKPIIKCGDYRRRPEQYCKICVDIPGLKGRFFGREASNAVIFLKLSEWSFSLTVKLKIAEENLVEYLLEVKKLPGPINKDFSRSFYKVRRSDEVVVMLCKAKPMRWDAMISSNGLDQTAYVPEEALSGGGDDAKQMF